MKPLLLALSLLMVAGCATDPLAIKAVADSNAKIAKTATIDITCPPTGCVFANFKYTDPNNKHYQKMPTNGWDALTSLGHDVKDVATGTVPGLIVGSVVRKGFDAAGHNVSNVASGDGSSTGGAGSFSQIGPDSANSADVTTTTSHDSHAVATTTTSTDNHADNSQTATPTVVTTQAPVAVLP